MAVLDTNELLFTAFEPKVKNQFIMRLGDSDIPAFMVRTVSAPGFTDQVITLHHINSYRKIRGKREWKDISMTLYDPITPAGSQAVMEWARLAYESVTGRAGYSDFYKKDVVLDILGPVGDVVGEWIIKGAFISESNFGDYDFSASETVDLTLTLACDFCVLNY